VKINEAEQRLGMSRSNIRFYEKEGLIDPVRLENGYRDYSEQDIEQLKKIIILRKLGVPLESIRDLQDGAVSLDQVLSDSKKSLEKQLREIRGAVSVLDELGAEQGGLEDLRTDYYWERIESEESRGNSFVDIAKDYLKFQGGVLEDQFSGPHPDGAARSERLRDTVLGMILTAVAFAVTARLLGKSMAAGLAVWAGLLVLGILLMLPAYFLRKKGDGREQKYRKAVQILVLGLVCAGWILLIVLAR